MGRFGAAYLAWRCSRQSHKWQWSLGHAFRCNADRGFRWGGDHVASRSKIQSAYPLRSCHCQFCKKIWKLKLTCKINYDINEARVYMYYRMRLQIGLVILPLMLTVFRRADRCPFEGRWSGRSGRTYQMKIFQDPGNRSGKENVWQALEKHDWCRLNCIKTFNNIGFPQPLLLSALIISISYTDLLTKSFLTRWKALIIKCWISMDKGLIVSTMQKGDLSEIWALIQTLHIFRYKSWKSEICQVLILRPDVTGSILSLT